MKVAISMRSVHEPLLRGDMRIIDFIKYAASLAVDGVELDDAYLHGAGADFTEIQEVLRETGLEVSCYDIDHQAEGLKGKARQQALEKIKAELVIAKSFGARYVKIVGGAFDSSVTAGDVEVLILQLVDMILPALQGTDLTLVIENPESSEFHSEHLARLLHQIDHPQVKAGFNMANAFVAGEDPRLALEYLKDQIVHVRIVDVRLAYRDEEPQSGSYVGCVVGLGLVPLEKLFAVLRAQGYQGWISLEFTGLEDSYFGTEASLKNLRQYLEELQSDVFHPCEL